MVAPLVSVVIVSYNSRGDLESCLPTLLTQNLPLEIVVVDNGSSDGTADWLRLNYPAIRLIHNVANDGYAGGNNLGVKAAQGEYVFILNPDTEVYPGAIATMLEVLQQHPSALVTPKLLCADGTINACGNKMHVTGITTCNGLGEPADTYNGVFPVCLLSGAAFLMARDVWNKIGGFGPDYFMYMEDVDFSLRARLLGYDILCCAQAVVVHKWDLRLTAQKFYYLERNRLVTLLKLYETRTFLRLWFSFLITELGTWVYACYKGLPFIKARVRSYWSVWKSRKQIMQNRIPLQGSRKVSDAELLSQMSLSLPFDMVVPPTLARILLKTTTPLYKAMNAWGNRM